MIVSMPLILQESIDGIWVCYEEKSNNSILDEESKKELKNFLFEELPLRDEVKEEPYLWSIEFDRAKVIYEPCFGCEKERYELKKRNDEIYFGDTSLTVSELSNDSLTLRSDNGTIYYLKKAS